MLSIYRQVQLLLTRWSVILWTFAWSFSPNRSACLRLLWTVSWNERLQTVKPIFSRSAKHLPTAPQALLKCEGSFQGSDFEARARRNRSSAVKRRISLRVHTLKAQELFAPEQGDEPPLGKRNAETVMRPRLTVGDFPVDIIRHYSYVLRSMFARRIGPDPHAEGAKSIGGSGCPDILELETGDFAIIGMNITEQGKPKLPASASCGPDESIVLIPRKLLVDARAHIPPAV
jgi:hypothetical protein